MGCLCVRADVTTNTSGDVPSMVQKRGSERGQSTTQYTQERTHAQPDTNVNRNKGSSVQSQAEWYSKLKTQSLTDFLFFKSLVIVR